MGLFDAALAIITNVPSDVGRVIDDPFGTVRADVLDPLGIGSVSVSTPIGELSTVPVAGPSPLPTTIVVQEAREGIVDITGFGGGNGKTATRTIVQTLDLATNRIVSQKVLEGSPKLMNKDVSAMRKVLRISADLRKKTPKQATKPSKMTELKNAIVNSAIANAGAACAPKC